MACCKLRLTEDQAIHFPILLCPPLNADFDGDTIAITLVPESARQETYDRLSPRYMNIYKKNNEPIFVFAHEALNGFAVSSEYTFDDPKELTDPRYFYTDYKQLLKDVEIDKKIKIGTPIVFTGTLGGVDYQSKITCYGRLRISKIIEADVDKIGIFKSPYERGNAKSAAKLCRYLYQFPDGVEKMRELQKFFLRVVTKAGVVTFDFSTLTADWNDEIYKKLTDIADSPKLTDKQKLLMMTEQYGKYEKDVEGKFPEELKDELARANRVKLTSIAAMTMPQLIISSVDEIPVITRGTLLSGYTEKDYDYHAIENRSLQSIKTSGVRKLESSSTIKLQNIAGMIEKGKTIIKSAS